MAVCANGHENPDGLAICRSCGALFIGGGLPLSRPTPSEPDGVEGTAQPASTEDDGEGERGAR